MKKFEKTKIKKCLASVGGWKNNLFFTILNSIDALLWCPKTRLVTTFDMSQLKSLC